MKLGLKTIVLALVVALLCVPAAFAKGGHEGGHGHGKPSWAGGGGGNGHGKPAWAGLGKSHADKAKAKHEKVKNQKAGSEDAAALDGELTLDDLNPAWYCKTLESMMDTADADATAGGAEPGDFSSFDSEFGTNDNKRNSFGKCVSARAQGGEDLSGALDNAEQQSCDQTADDGSEDPAADDGTDTSAADEGTDTSTADEGTDTSTADEGTDTSADDDPADDGSGDQADDCQADDSAADDSEEGDQADDEQAGAADDQGEETEVAAFARALVRFIKL